jgi:hypothetical protein
MLLRLLLLQDLVGGPSAFEPFMRHYLHTFSFKTVDSQQFKATFCDFFKDTPASECKPCTARWWFGRGVLQLDTFTAERYSPCQIMRKLQRASTCQLVCKTASGQQ